MTNLLSAEIIASLLARRAARQPTRTHVQAPVSVSRAAAQPIRSPRKPGQIESLIACPSNEEHTMAINGVCECGTYDRASAA